MEIGNGAFYAATLAGTLAVPNTVMTIGNAAYASTKLAGFDLSKANSLDVEIKAGAFSDISGIPWRSD